MDKYRVTLTAEERAALEHLVSCGKAAARKLIHARILLLADDALGDDCSDEHIVAAGGTGALSESGACVDDQLTGLLADLATGTGVDRTAGGVAKLLTAAA